MRLQTINSRFSECCVVAASGPSLTQDVADLCEGLPVIAVNDAWRLIPSARVLYAADSAWWEHHGGCPEFQGERWSSHGSAHHDDKRGTADRYGIHVVRGLQRDGFSFDPGLIHYGDNSGFQAINLAGHMMGWRGRVLLVGFDMRVVDGKRHFFGEHPPGLRSTQTGYDKWPKKFAAGAASLPASIKVVNCTPGSALTCFSMMDLAEAIKDKQC